MSDPVLAQVLELLQKLDTKQEALAAQVRLLAVYSAYGVMMGGGNAGVGSVHHRRRVPSSSHMTRRPHPLSLIFYRDSSLHFAET